MMEESKIEQYLKQQVEKLGGKAFKFTSPGVVGVPDRLVLLPGGRIILVELKAPGKKPRPIQVKVIEKIRSLGFRVEVIDNKEQVLEMLENMHEDNAFKERLSLEAKICWYTFLDTGDQREKEIADLCIKLRDMI